MFVPEDMSLRTVLGVPVVDDDHPLFFRPLIQLMDECNIRILVSSDICSSRFGFSGHLYYERVN